MIGLAGLEYSTQCRYCLFSLRRRHRSHQPGLQCRIECYRLADCLLPIKFVSPLDRIFYATPIPQGALARSAFLARPIRNGDQHHFAHVSRELLHFLFLSDRPTGDGEDDELELCYVWRYYFVCNKLLCCNWQARIPTAGRYTESGLVSNVYCI